MVINLKKKFFHTKLKKKQTHSESRSALQRCQLSAIESVERTNALRCKNPRNHAFFLNECLKLKVRFLVSVQHSKCHSKPHKHTQRKN